MMISFLCLRKEIAELAEVGLDRAQQFAHLARTLLDCQRGLFIRFERELVDRRIDRDRPCVAAFEPVGQHQFGVVGGLLFAEGDEAEFARQ